MQGSEISLEEDSNSFRVTAIGDIMLIDPQDLKRPKPPVAGEEMSIRPRPEPVRAAPAEAPIEAPVPKAQ